MFARFIYNHSRYFALIIVCVIAVGITSFRSIARQEDPTLTNFIATITVFYPGASPDRVEALVTRPLEDELREISEIDELRSISSSGVSFFNIRLLDTLAEDQLERAWSRSAMPWPTPLPSFHPGWASQYLIMIASPLSPRL